MKFISTSSVGGDETQSFDVKDYKGIFGEFVEEVLTKYKSEWGKFEIENTAWFVPSSFDYKHGELLKEIPQELLDKKIVKVQASGGWSNMNYYLYLENTENNGQERKITFEDAFLQDYKNGFLNGVEYAKNTLIEDACKVFCKHGCNDACPFVYFKDNCIKLYEFKKSIEYYGYNRAKSERTDE